MHILVLGSGGRESALAWKIKQSTHCKKLFIAPGNAGTTQYGINIHLDILDFESIKNLCIQEKISLVVVGPEEPLVHGIYDFFVANNLLKNIHIIAPSKQAAQLEGSKAFAKKFMQKQNIPTASYKEFTNQNFDEGITYINSHTLPIVLKADGLAAGKGVIICNTTQEAIMHYTEMLQDKKFGSASEKIIIEEFLQGTELSVFILTNGKKYTLLPTAKDYKRIGEGDVGLNTGGMGAISPVPFATEAYLKVVEETIIEPTLKGIQEEKMIYHGFIFFGLINVENKPYVIEYNCRLGDPETETILPRIENDIIDLWLEILDEKNQENPLCKISPLHATTTVLTAGGYPEIYKKGTPMQITPTEKSLIFHAGTALKENQLVTNGGRVVAITSLAETLSNALEINISSTNNIQFEGKYFRKDIGFEFI